MKKKVLISAILLVALGIACVTIAVNRHSGNEKTVEDVATEESIEVSDENSEGEDLNIEISLLSEKYWDLYDLEDTDIASKEALEALTETYMEKLPEALNMPEWWESISKTAKNYQIVFSINDEAESKTSSKAHYLNEETISTKIALSSSIATSEGGLKDAGLAHELTHGMGFMENFSISLDEGFCNYAQFLVGDWAYDEEYTFDKYEIAEVQALEAGYSEELSEIVEEIGVKREDYPFSGDENQIWYRLSQSFVEFLIDKYGFEDAKNLCLNGVDESSYETMLGESLESLREEWLEGLLNAESEYTVQQFQEHMLGVEFPSQYIVVVADGSDATLTFYEKQEDSSYKEILSTSAKIGANGIGKTKEGDRKTPTGEFTFIKAFGIKDDPGTSFDYTKVDDSYYWVDDPDSKYYNQFVSTNDVEKDWSSAEHIIDVPGTYDYVLALSYNEECTPGAGSAIFLHCKPTSGAGCIAIDEDVMVEIMKKINTDCVITIQ